MLASQISLLSQRPSIPLLLMASNGPSIILLRTSSIAPSSGPQQTRGFRFDLWNSYLGPDFDRRQQHRNRITKHRNAEALNRKLSWEWQRPLQASRRGLNGFMSSAWRRHDAPGGKWVDINELNAARKRTRNSYGIDNEQNGLEKLWSHESRVHFEQALNGYGLKLMKWATNTNMAEPKMSRTHDTASNHGNETTSELPPKNNSSDGGYVIDPISNRKVFQNSRTCARAKEPRGSEIDIQTFKGYRPQFKRFVPNINIRERGTVNLDSRLNSSHVMEASPLPIHYSKILNLDEPPSDTELNKYKPYTYNEPHGQQPEVIDPLAWLPSQAELGTYKSFMYNEPDGQLPGVLDTTREPSQAELKSYKAFRYNEPDGKPLESLDAVTEPSEAELKSYKAFRYNEPDGQPHEDPNIVIEPSEAELRGYKAFRYNEPDGQPSNVANAKAELSEADLKSYKAFRYNEPDGHPPYAADAVANGLSDYDRRAIDVVEAPVSRLSKSRLSAFDKTEIEKVEDLDLLRASDIRASSGIMRSIKKESEAEKRAKRNELEEDFIEFQTISTNFSAAPKDRKTQQGIQELELECSELLNHNAHARGWVDEKMRELDSKAAQFPDRQSTARPSMRADEVLNTIINSDNCLNEGKASGHQASRQSASVSTSYIDNIDSVSSSTKLGNMTGYFGRDFPGEPNISWTAEGSATNNSLIPKAKETDIWGYDKTPTGLELSFQKEMEDKVQNPENCYAAGLGSVEEFSRNPNTSRLQTSLQRQTTKLMENSQPEVDQYTKDPTGLEVSYAEECVERGEPEPAIFISSYGSSARSSQSTEGTPGETSALSAEPTLYKILAYDPMMQTVDIAETTSVVTDASSPLTPAEVLLRLSNPAKFFPHFQPLQNQGYEIVSGSGDVLVFRKVRDGVPAVTLSQASSQSRRITNPIDGMQTIRPATGNFASPTGFVNHDLPEEVPFKSGIDVRRQEPVFSGQNSGWQDTERSKAKKPRTAKKLLIGAAWVAGCSYAAGVLVEFFRTA